MSESNRKKAVIYLTEWNSVVRAVRRLEEANKSGIYRIPVPPEEETPKEEVPIPDLDDE